ncbi:condensation domain-containing protein [Streptomyces lasalocidi]
MVIGTAVGNRPLGYEDTVGMFVNTIPLALVLDGAAPAQDTMDDVTDTLIRALPHQDVPVQELTRALGMHTSGADNPLFSVMFSAHDRAAARDRRTRPRHHPLRRVQHRHHPLRPRRGAAAGRPARCHPAPWRARDDPGLGLRRRPLRRGRGPVALRSLPGPAARLPRHPGGAAGRARARRRGACRPARSGRRRPRSARPRGRSTPVAARPVVRRTPSHLRRARRARRPRSRSVCAPRV